METNRVRGSRKRANILTAIAELSARDNRPPTIRDIAELLKISRSACHYHIDILVESGQLGRMRGTRGLYIPSASHA